MTVLFIWPTIAIVTEEDREGGAPKGLLLEGDEASSIEDRSRVYDECLLPTSAASSVERQCGADGEKNLLNRRETQP